MENHKKMDDLGVPLFSESPHIFKIFRLDPNLALGPVHWEVDTSLPRITVTNNSEILQPAIGW